MKARFTAKQGQYLAFIHYYTKVNDCPPAEADMQRYFRVTPPTCIRWCSCLKQGASSNGHPAAVGRSG
jgi:hypothetical protein